MKIKILSVFFVTAATVGFYLLYTPQASRSIASLSEGMVHTSVKFSQKDEVFDFADANRVSLVEKYGTLEVEVVDFIEEGTHIENYFLQVDEDRIPLNILNEEDVSHLVKKSVQILGWEDRNSHYSFSAFIESDKQTTNSDVTIITPERMLVLLVNFNDSLPVPDRTDGKEKLETHTFANYLNRGYFGKFFQETLQGRAWNKVTHVEDWYTFNMTCDDKPYPTSGNPKSGYIRSEDMQLIMAQRGLNLNDFDNITVITNCNHPMKWGVASSFSKNGRRITTTNNVLHAGDLWYDSELEHQEHPEYSFNLLNTLLMHERGHNFGFSHANGYDCGLNRIFPCSDIGYGNPFDVMGTDMASIFINADELRKESYRDESQYLHISAPGIYTIDPLISKSRTAKVGAYLYSKFHSQPIFMLENRIAEGLDKTLIHDIYKDVREGLLLYTTLGPSTVSPLKSPRWVDGNFRIMDPKVNRKFPFIEGNRYNFGDRIREDAITTTNSFVDPITGLKVNVLSKSGVDKKVRFKVEYDESARKCYKNTLESQAQAVSLELREYNGGGQLAGSLGGMGGGMTSKIPSPTGPDYLIHVNQGEYFIFKMHLAQTSPSYCPRDKIRATVLDTHKYADWMVNPDIIPTTVGEDYNKSYNMISLFTAPEGALPGRYKVEVKFENLRTGKIIVKPFTFKLNE